jgi:hypothetical protein
VLRFLDQPALGYRLAGLQREACITAASVIGPADPARWLGKTIGVLTDGGFAQAGCPQLAAPARRQCRAGAAGMDEALVTFS